MIHRVTPHLLPLFILMAGRNSYGRGIDDAWDRVSEWLREFSAGRVFGDPVEVNEEAREIIGKMARALRQQIEDARRLAAQIPGDMLRDIAVMAEPVGLPLTALLLKDMARESDAGTLDAMKRFEELQNRVYHELGRAVFLYVECGAEKFLVGDQLLGEPVSGAFSEASFDIERAGECLALNQPTAAVFHLMRVMEFTLRAFRKHLGEPDPVGRERNWGDMLDAIARSLNARKWSKGEREPFDVCFANMNGVRVAWRNPSMHIERNYTLDEAAHVKGAVQLFSEELIPVLAITPPLKTNVS